MQMVEQQTKISTKFNPLTQRGRQLNDLQLETALFKYSLLQAEKFSSLRNKNFQLATSISQLSYNPNVDTLKRILKERGDKVQNPGEIEKVISRQLISLTPIEKHQQTLIHASQQNGLSDLRQNQSSQNSCSGSYLIGTFAEQTQRLIQNINSMVSVFKNGMRVSEVDRDLKDLAAELNQQTWISSTSSASAVSASHDNNLRLAVSKSADNEDRTSEPHGISKLIAKRKRKVIEQSIKSISEKEESLTQQRTSKEDTKNLLKNFGNAQQRFVLNSCAAKKYIDTHLSAEKSEEFMKWVQQLKLENFEQFKNAWLVPDVTDDSDDFKEFKMIYRELCFDFYENHASVYVLSSQMRSEHTRKTHIKYISRFLDGIVNPSSFYYFKKA